MEYELATFDDEIKLLIIMKVFVTDIKFNKKMLLQMLVQFYSFTKAIFKNAI